MRRAGVDVGEPEGEPEASAGLRTDAARVETAPARGLFLWKVFY